MPPWSLAIAGTVLGAILGSFLATLCLRWPEDRSVLTGRSACDGCGRTLGPGELLPILSALVSRGRCNICGGKIDSTHMRIELSSALIGGAAGFLALALIAFAYHKLRGREGLGAGDPKLLGELVYGWDGRHCRM